MKKAVKTLLVVSLGITLGAIPAMAKENTSSFTDVQPSHWAYSMVEWGAGNHILSGYEDHTFKPDQTVTEAEFLKMLISSFENVAESGTQWYDKYYAYALAKGWYIPGLTNKLAINHPVSRGNVALILASAMGNRFVNGNDADVGRAIEILYEKNLSEGKTAKTVEGFAPKDNLTRAEAVTFVHQFKLDSGLASLPSVVDWSKYEQVGFTNVEAAIDKQRAFASANGLQAREYKDDKGAQFIDFYKGDQSAIVTSYQTEQDGTLNWTVEGHYGVADYTLLFDYISHMTSFVPQVQSDFQNKIFPSLKGHGIRSTDDMSCTFGPLSVKGHYTQETDSYHFIIRVSPK